MAEKSLRWECERNWDHKRGHQGRWTLRYRTVRLEVVPDEYNGGYSVCPVEVRHPLIPGFQATAQNLPASSYAPPRSYPEVSEALHRAEELARGLCQWVGLTLPPIESWEPEPEDIRPQHEQGRETVPLYPAGEAAR